MVNWKEIRKDFSEYYQQEWKEAGLTYQDAQEWIPVGFELDDYYLVKEWKNHNFTAQEAKSWIDTGLNPQETNFITCLKQKNIHPSQLATDNLFQLRKEFYPGYPQAQAYLDKNYPCSCNNYKKKCSWSDELELIHQENCLRENLYELNLRNLNLEGDLDLKEFRDSEKIYLAGNPRLGEIKNKPTYITILVYQTSQEWLNHQYPNKEQVKEILVYKYNRFGIGDREVVLSGYSNLEAVIIDGNYLDSELNKLKINNCPKLTSLLCCRSNKLTSLTLNCLSLVKLEFRHSPLASLDLITCPNLQEINCYENQLTEVKLSQEKEKLEYLDLNSNNFNQDLSFLKHLVNLKKLYLEGNKFFGSLEYLPDSIKIFRCFADKKKDAKIRNIYNLFADENGKVEIGEKMGNSTYADAIKNFPQKLQVWKETNPNLMQNAQEIPELEKIFDNLSLALVNGKIENETTSKVLDIFQFESEERIKEMRKQNQEYYQAQILQPTNLPPNTPGSK